MFSMACSSWLQFSSASCQHQTNALLLFLTCSPALQHYCHWHCSSETCCCYIPITVSHNIPLIPIPQSCSHSQCPCSTSASQRRFVVYRSGSFQMEKVVEVGAGVAFFYPKKSETFICSKNTYSVLEQPHQLPRFSNRFLESAPVCPCPFLLRSCNCFPGLRWRLQLCHLPGPLGSSLYPQSLRGGTARAAVSTQPRVHSWGSLRECQLFHKAMCDSLHLHCQAAWPGVPPTTTGGVFVFVLDNTR